MSLFQDLTKDKNYTASERHLAEYLIEHAYEIIEMTLENLSKATFTSKATIFRFLKKNGYDGFNDFKTQMILDLSLLLKENSDNLLSLPFEKNDNLEDIADNVTSRSMFSIIETKRTNSVEKLTEVVSLMEKAHQIIFIGKNFTRIVAEDAALRFLRLGLPICTYNNLDEASAFVQYCPENTVAFLLSYSGEIETILKLGEFLTKRKATCISITGNTNNRLKEMCSVNLYINAFDSVKKNTSTTSRIAMMNLLDILVMFYISRNYEAVYEKLNQFEYDV